MVPASVTPLVRVLDGLGDCSQSVDLVLALLADHVQSDKWQGEQLTSSMRRSSPSLSGRCRLIVVFVDRSAARRSTVRKGTDQPDVVNSAVATQSGVASPPPQSGAVAPPHDKLWVVTPSGGVRSCDLV
jgi:hypothetical protein